MATGRESMSSAEIAALINDSINAVPGLINVKVSVVRLPNPEINGCNWSAGFGPMPLNCSPESQQLLRDIIENARSHFNLWEMH